MSRALRFVKQQSVLKEKRVSLSNARARSKFERLCST